MARTPRKQRAPSPLDGVRERIKEAERKSQSVGREQVGLDVDGYENIATLIERGFGKKPDVLRQALALGLRSMVTASSSKEASDEREYPDLYDDTVGEDAAITTHALGVLSSALTSSNAPIGQPIVTPPSVARRVADGEEVDTAPPEAVNE